MTAEQYPTANGQAGPNLGYAYDTMGRLNTLTDLTAQSSIISGTTYGPSNELLTMSGLVTETRTYNSMLQLLSLVASASAGPTVNMTYAYSSTQNNGKLTSQTDNISGEQVVYTYDALNRLASAAATSNSWGQSFSYDGFGNLTGQTVTAGSAPSYSVTPDPSTNHLGGEDANGNTPYSNDANGTNYVMTYDVENRYTGSLTSTGLFMYGYAPGNKRVYRGVENGNNLVTDEVTYWSPAGKRLATYQMVLNGSQYVAVQTETYYWFGGKLIRNASGYVAADRLGSIGKFYPYGLEKPSATTNGTEKFTGYLRDAETGLDYADQRYHDPGTGRFMTPDPYMATSGGAIDPSNPGSWNRYAYAQGDPVNFIDPRGLLACSPDVCASVSVNDDEGDSGDGDAPQYPSHPTQSSVGVPVKKIQNEIRSALRVALRALQKASCAGLFDANVNGSPTPATELQNLFSDLSQVEIGNIPSTPGTVTSATTTPGSSYLLNVDGGQQLLYSSVTIKINNVAGSFVTGSTQDQAITLLHELGHAYSDLFGPQSTQIQSDSGSTSASMANTALVTQNCFK